MCTQRALDDDDAYGIAACAQRDCSDRAGIGMACNGDSTPPVSPPTCRTPALPPILPMLCRRAVARSKPGMCRNARPSRAVAPRTSHLTPRASSLKPRTCLLPLLIIFCTFATGCTPWKQWLANGLKVGPNYGKPPAPVARDWIDANDKRINSSRGDTENWWAVFQDPVLNKLVVFAYNQNLTLREAGFRVLQARANAAIARGEFFPQQQSAIGNYTYKGISKKAANTSFIPQRFFDQWQLGFGATWELDFWGRYRRAIEAADADLDASVEEYDDVLVTLIGDIATSYTQLRTLEQQLRLVRANVELQRATLGIADARFRGGATTELDVDQAQSNLSQTEALLPQFAIQHRFASTQLCVLLGIPPEDVHAMLGEGRIPVAPPEVVIGVPADLLARRPDVRQAEREVAAESARIGIATSELYPHISITGSINYQAEVFRDMFNPLAFAPVAGAGFQWNVLQYGRLMNGIRWQDARFQEAIASYQNTVLNAAREVENGLVQFLQGQVKARALEQSVVASMKAVRISLAQYRGGNVDFNRIALLEQNLVQQQDALTRARGDVALGLIEAYRAIGGGWQIRYNPASAAALAGDVSPPLPEEDKPINLVPEIPMLKPVIPPIKIEAPEELPKP